MFVCVCVCVCVCVAFEMEVLWGVCWFVVIWPFTFSYVCLKMVIL